MTSATSQPPPPPSLDYERGPQLGLVAIDETADGGVCVRIARHPLRVKQIVSATVLWTLTAVVAFFSTIQLAMGEFRPVVRLFEWLLCAGGIGIAGWLVWPRRYPPTELFATPRGLQYTRGRTHYEVPRSRVRRVATCISPPKLAWTHPVSVVVYFDDGNQWVVWSGGRDEGCAISAALRRGLGISEESE